MKQNTQIEIQNSKYSVGEGQMRDVPTWSSKRC